MLRPKIPQHFTASAVVINHGYVLLVYHQRIGGWVQPGGHIEPFEMPQEAAVREVLEETGVEVEIVCDSAPPTEDVDAFFLQPPLCMHAVRAFEEGSDVYHLDLIYLCKPLGNLNKILGNGLMSKHDQFMLPIAGHGNEVKEASWVKLSYLKNLSLAKNVLEAIKLACDRLLPEDLI